MSIDRWSLFSMRELDVLILALGELADTELEDDDDPAWTSIAKSLADEADLAQGDRIAP